MHNRLQESGFHLAMRYKFKTAGTFNKMAEFNLE